MATDQIFEMIPKEKVLLLSILFTIEAFWIFLSNIATIITFATNRNIFRRAVYCLINLPVSDIFYGLFLACYYNYVAYTAILRYEVLLALETIKVTAGVSSGTCLLLVALERVYVTYFPFRHRTTGPRAWAISIAICWCFPLFVSVVFLHVPPDVSKVLTPITFCCASLSLIMIMASYIAIYIKVKSQNKILHNQPTSSQTAVLRERNMAYTMLLVTVLSFVTWIPFLVVRISKQTGTNSSSLTFHLTSLVQATNSFINSIIYALRMKEFRRALLRLLCSSRRRQVQPGDTQGRSQGTVKTSRN